MPRVLKETSQFKTDKKRIKKSGRYDWEKMRSVVKERISAIVDTRFSLIVDAVSA